MSIYDSAIGYAKKGMAIHWLHQRAKRPVGEWQTEKARTTEELKASYRTGYNVGWRPGRLSEVGGYYMYAIDVDVRADGHQDEILAHLKRILGDPQDFPATRSGSGGSSRHIYFLSDQLLASRLLAQSEASVLDAKTGKPRSAWEIELYGEGKQLVLPPSIHPDTGKPYVWVREIDWDAAEMGLAYVLDDEYLDQLGAPRPSVSDDPLESDLDWLAAQKPPLDLSDIGVDYYLSVYANDDLSYDLWLEVGAALHHQYDGGETGLEKWHEWSAVSGKYDADDLERRYASFGRRSGRSTTFATVIHRAGGRANVFDLARKELAEAKDRQDAIRIIGHHQLLESERDILIEDWKEAEREAGNHFRSTAFRADVRQAQEASRDSAGRDLEVQFIRQFIEKYFPPVETPEGKKSRCILYHARMFWTHTKGRWVPEEEAYIAHLLQRWVQEVREQDHGVFDQFVDLFSDSGKGTVALTNTLVKALANAVAVSSDSDPLRLKSVSPEPLINARNGTAVFKADSTYEILPHNPSRRLTSVLGSNIIPEAECPYWDAMLVRLFRDQEEPTEVIRHLEECLGYMIQSTRDVPMGIIAHGRGSNGKSSVFKIITELMGSAALPVNFSSAATENAHWEAQLVGKQMLIDDDFPTGAMIPDGKFKKYSENKLITANPKHAGQFQFQVGAVIVLLGNDWPRCRDASHGFARRVQAFDFNTLLTEEESDSTLPRRIIQWELPGVLNRLIAGYQRFLQRGSRFAPPADCIAAKRRMLNEGNMVRLFVDECLVADPVGRVKASEAYEEYAAWCSDSGIETPAQRRSFLRDIRHLGIQVDEGHARERVLVGVAFAPRDDELFGEK